MRLIARFMSLPGAVPVSRVKRSASVPYSSITSIGSITLPAILLIFLPYSSLTNPFRYTIRNGTSSVKERPIITIRATQKNRMS